MVCEILGMRELSVSFKVTWAGNQRQRKLANRSRDQIGILQLTNLFRIGKSYVKSGGVILLTSGMLANEPMPGSAAVSAVNGAINSFVKAAALELGDKLRINAVSPVFVKETMVAMGMDGSKGMSADDTAKAYVAALEGSMNGEVVDVRDWA